MQASLNHGVASGLLATLVALIHGSFLLADNSTDDSITDVPELASLEAPYLPRMAASPGRYVGVRQYI